MAGQGRVHSASSPSCVSRSLDRTLLDAQDTCELKLSGRKLKDYPKAAAKYNLSDTVLAGKEGKVLRKFDSLIHIPNTHVHTEGKYVHKELARTYTHTYTHIHVI